MYPCKLIRIIALSDILRTIPSIGIGLDATMIMTDYWASSSNLKPITFSIPQTFYILCYRLNPIPSPPAGGPNFPAWSAASTSNTCSLGQLSRRSMDGMQRFQEQWLSYGASAWYELWMGELADARARFARLINARPHEIAILSSVGVALSVIGSSLDFSARPDVVVTEMDFPTIPYQWMARGEEGAELRLLASPDRVQVPLESFAQAIGPRTGLVATTHVFFTSGWVQDIAAIARLTHNAGALCLVDGYQAAGRIPT